MKTGWAKAMIRGVLSKSLFMSSVEYFIARVHLESQFRQE